MAQGNPASLPMYDWPEVRETTDAFWAVLRARLASCGFEAPGWLDRATPSATLWRSPDLLFSQTCGWPLVSGFFKHVQVVAIPSYAVTGCGSGTYRSALVAKLEDEPLLLARGRIAINSRDSLSGYRTLANTLARGGLTAGQVGSWLETGGHRASIVAVAEGRADLASIDALSWQLALDHEPAAKMLHVVGWTDELPALPFVTAKKNSERVVDVLQAVQVALAISPQAYLQSVRAGSVADYAPVVALGSLVESAGFD